jgi:hypothetical protein
LIISGRFKATSWEQIRAFLAGSGEVRVDGQRREEVYGWTERALVRHEYGEYGQPVFERLSRISVAQLYRFRNHRCKPRPMRRPGCLRIDTVHQGDRDGNKGVYHINAEDEATQWEVVTTAPQISEYGLIPLLEQLLEQFRLLSGDSIPTTAAKSSIYTVAKLLGKLLVEQTKSRAHRAGDNGLVESKNGAAVRKHMGFGHIGAQHAEAVNPFHRQYLKPYINFRRSCSIAEIVELPNSKRRRVYRKWVTPFEIFSQTPERQRYLRASVSLGELKRLAAVQSAPEAAIAMQQAKQKLLSGISRRSA